MAKLAKATFFTLSQKVLPSTYLMKAAPSRTKRQRQAGRDRQAETGRQRQAGRDRQAETGTQHCCDIRWW
jgi:hypothetical protein